MDDRMLITPEVMNETFRQLRRLPERGLAPAVAHERVLRQVIEERMLQIAGRLCLSEVPCGLVRRTVQDMDQLVLLAVTATRTAYQRLLDELLPPDLRFGPLEGPAEGPGENTGDDEDGDGVESRS